MLGAKRNYLMTALLTLALLALPSLASAGAGPTAPVSGPSPFAGCTAGDTGALVYENAEVEPHVAVNPVDPDNLIGAWQQDRWSDGGARGLVAGVSTDGGATWTRVPLPFSTCADPAVGLDRATDPWVSFGPDGVAYTAALAFNAFGPENGIYAATSFNGGLTWVNRRAVIEDTSPQFFSDKEAITADPTTPGTAYLVWDRLESPNGNPRSAARAFAYRGPTYFSKTTDWGDTWSAPKVIVATAANRQTIGNVIVVDKNTGTLYNFFNYITMKNQRPFQVAFVKSTDGGATWSKVQVVATLQSVFVADPNTGEWIRTGDILPAPAVDPETGKLYVAWQDARFNGGQYDEIALSHSSDGGATWSAPARVNTPTGRPAFTPSIRVSADGTLGLTYYDFRNMTGDPSTLPTDYWFTSSSDGGVTFSPDTHLAGPFDMKTAPYAGGYFLGDYEGLDVAGNAFNAFYVGANSGDLGNRTDVFAVSVTP